MKTANRRFGALTALSLGAALMTVGQVQTSVPGFGLEQMPEETQTPPQATGTNETGAVQQRRGRGGSRFGGRLEGMYKSQVNANWFANNTKFWYRNDLSEGAKEFILVDAERGTRERAFDQEAVAKQIGEGTEAAKLPVEALKFSEDGESVTLLGRAGSWQLNLKTGKVQESGEKVEATSEGLPAGTRPRPSTRTGPETEITFDNQLNREVEIYWLDESGARQSYGKIEPRSRKAQHTFSGHVWLVVDERGEMRGVFEATDRPDVAVIADEPARPARERPQSGQRRGEPSNRSPDGKWTISIREQNVFIRDEAGQEIQLSTDGNESNSYRRAEWSPDSKTVIAWRVEPGERKEVYLIRSSPPGGGRATMESRPYALPGDKFSKFEPNLFDVASCKQTKPDVDRFEHEWQSPPVNWNRDGSRFRWLQVDRGHQRLRVIEVDARSGATRNLIDEKSDTFVWTAHTETLRLQLVNYLEKSDEIIYVSEQDGWRHLYLVKWDSASSLSGADRLDARPTMRQITKGDWVVRGIDQIDEDARQIWFTASGKQAGQDPYFIHYYRVNFDGGGLVALTEGNGNHSVVFSPDRKFILDSYSRPDAPPVNELRRVSDGKLVCKLEEADITELKAKGWKAPEVFVAKGRDGKTDIWGLIYRPRDFDPNKKYPVIEDIYAGPQGSFVPKTFGGTRYQNLTDAGFIVAKVDGMGTANRSKAFHDVCWKNLKDAGFPDRILWHKAVAAKYPHYDVTRVGICGTSAGGQNAGGAVLFHPEFYRAAVANSGCHDNRMDKASWNEQWMGYPVGPQYSECSNIDNASKLQGHLFLVVGELDSNVPPESTMRYADALVRARKDFDFLVIPNGGHGAGGEYYQRRMRDFFVRHLQGVEPPNNNARPESPAGS
jgi:dipeptidyl aminopeptidase/acylaminoacyl peptidase